MNDSDLQNGSTSPFDPDDLVELGVVGRPQGLKGQVRVHLFDVGPTEIERLPTDRLIIKFSLGNRLRELRLAEFRFHRGIWIVSLEQITSCEDAEQLRGALVCVPRQELWAPEADEYFEFDLVGLEVFNERDGEKLGEVHSLRQTGGEAMIVVRHQDGFDFLLPTTWTIIKNIDLPGRKMLIDPPEGLIDLNKPGSAKNRSSKKRPKSGS